jgi:hypothetical protein
MDICGYNMLRVEHRKLPLFNDSELTPIIKELIHSNSRIETCNINCDKVENDVQAAVKFSRSKESVNDGLQPCTDKQRHL